MPVIKLEIEDFLENAKRCPVFDVRSEGEYNHAHIPGAFSLPLFNNEERIIVGTTYKQQSREDAIKISLPFFGNKMVGMIETAEKIAALINPENKTVLVHCWRGGMRSAGVAWLLDLYGFEVYSLIGGYKTYRHWVLEQFEKDYPFNVLGGNTGSGKTILLHHLEKQEEVVIDLEKMAGHKGSAFGNIHLIPQPSQEMFENIFAVDLAKKAARATELNKPIWIEDESQRIGQVNMPIQVWNLMRNKPLYFLNIDFEHRLQHIVSDYGKGDLEKLVNAIIRIKKRLGPVETKTAISFLLDGNLVDSFRILLKYYDKHYLKALLNRQSLDELKIEIDCQQVDAKENANLVLQSTKHPI